MRGTALLRLGVALASIGVGTGSVAAAQAIYRCAPNIYSQQPCEGGERLAAADPRSSEQAAQARTASAGQMKLADRMQRERVALERTRPLSSAAGIGPLAMNDEPAGRKPRQPGKTASRKGLSNRSADVAAKPYKPGGFVAFAPGQVKPKRPATLRPKKPQD